MSQPTASAVFTLDELWLLQSVIRHEALQMDTWRSRRQVLLSTTT